MGLKLPNVGQRLRRAAKRLSPPAKTIEKPQRAQPTKHPKVIKGGTFDDLEVLRDDGILAFSSRSRPKKLLFYGTPRHASIIKTIPFAKFDRSREAWLLPEQFETLRILRREIPSMRYTEVAYTRAKSVWKDGVEEVKLLRYLQDLKSGAIPCDDIVGNKLQPFSYQQVAVKFLEEAWRRGFGVANFDEQGLGKTCTILIALDRWIEKDPDATVIIFAPKSLLHTVWVTEVAKFASNLRPLVLEGSIKRRAKMMREAEVYDWPRVREINGVKRTSFVKKPGRPNLYLINHEAASQMKKTHQGKVWNELVRECIQKKPTFLIVDELHKIANPSANRSKGITAIGKVAQNVHGMTGTPGLPMHLYGELKFIDPRIYPVNKGDFQSRYTVHEYWSEDQKKIVGYRNLKELEKRTAQFSIRRTQDELPSMPGAHHTPVFVEMTKAQHEAYAATAKQVLAFYREHDITKVNLPAKLYGLRSITGGHIKDATQKHIYFKKSGKIQALLDLLNQELSPNAFRMQETQKAVVACQFRADVDLISKSLTEQGWGHVVVTGDVKDTRKNKARTNAVNQFIEDPETQVLVGITSTFGVGLNLVPTPPQFCNLLIFYSNGYSSMERDQAEKRIKRRGQTRVCRFIDLLCKNTIDEVILEALKANRNIEEVVLGDNIRKALFGDKGK